MSSYTFYLLPNLHSVLCWVKLSTHILVHMKALSDVRLLRFDLYLYQRTPYIYYRMAARSDSVCRYIRLLRDQSSLDCESFQPALTIPDGNCRITMRHWSYLLIQGLRRKMSHPLWSYSSSNSTRGLRRQLHVATSTMLLHLRFTNKTAVIGCVITM